MLTGEFRGLLHELGSGKLSAATAEFLAGVPLDDLVSDLRTSYPVLFQERSISRKREVGVARSIRLELAAHQLATSPFQAIHLLPVLWRCVLVSSYDNVISELTAISSITVRPSRTTGEVILRMGRGYKLDRTPDEWVVRPLKRQRVALSEEFLRKRGWKFQAMFPFWTRS
jgi:DNA-binding transcriptional LysR family regulator